MTLTATSTCSEKFQRVKEGKGCIAALDQSGGSTPAVLKLYGVKNSEYSLNDERMHNIVHKMRTRIVTNKVFDGSRVWGAILFENTMDREMGGMPTVDYLWEKKNIVSFLKIDKGYAHPDEGVRLMKPIQGLEGTLKRAKDMGVFGTKMRAIILENFTPEGIAKVVEQQFALARTIIGAGLVPMKPIQGLEGTLKRAKDMGVFGTKMRAIILENFTPEGIAKVVEQQFALARTIIGAGLVPIVEPEIDIVDFLVAHKEEAEDILKQHILNHLDTLGKDERILLKLSLPSRANHYKDLMDHPNVIRVVALSGGYSRNEAVKLLAKNEGMVASFSRGLLQGLHVDMSDDEFSRYGTLQDIYESSMARQN